MIRGGAIGDFILTLPVFASLRQAFPRVPLQILGRPSIAQLAVAGGLADAIQDLDSASLSRLFTPLGRPDQPWIEYFAQFDLVISFIHDPNGAFRDNLRRITPATYLQGIARPQESDHLHAAEALLACLRTLAIPQSPPLPQLRVRGDAPPLPCPCIALHPGSGSKSKNWPLPRWRELVQALLAHSPCHLLLIGGEADTEECAQLLQTGSSPRLHTALNGPLVSLAGSLQSCQFFIGHDTGITHLAAALGVPCLVLWGPSQKRIWAPPQPQVTILEDPRGLSHLETSTVLSAVPPRFHEMACE